MSNISWSFARAIRILLAPLDVTAANWRVWRAGVVSSCGMLQLVPRFGKDGAKPVKMV
jgi:hypothetical protein